MIDPRHTQDCQQGDNDSTWRHHPAVSRRGFVLGASAIPLAGLVPAGRAHAAPRTPAGPTPAADGFPVVIDGEAAAVVVTPPGRSVPIPPIDIEAEAGQVTAPMRIVTDAAVDASGGAYVDSPSDGPLYDGELTLEIDIPAEGTYVLSARVWAQGGNADSFLVRVDDGDDVLWTFPTEDTWSWRPLTDNTSGTAEPVVYELSAGLHTITIGVREAGTRIDAIRVRTADDHVADSAATLVRCVASSTGVELPVLSAEDAADAATGLPPGRIHVGWSGPATPELADQRTAIARALDGLDDDGFVIDTADATMAIVGPTDWGTRFGVYEFLERYVGVRWLLPGEHGEEIPQHTTIVVPPGRIVEEPAFETRTMIRLWTEYSPDSPDWLSDIATVAWAAHNRTHSRVTRWNVEMWEVFRYDTYADPNSPDYDPDLYPIVNGTVKLPTSAADRAWQPRFTNPRTVDIAVDWVVSAFDRNPARPHYALNINDNSIFSETDDDGTINRIGLPNCSEAYYGWINQVVASAIEQRPQLASKLFNVLAYQNTVEPPSFPLHPAVVPWLCREHLGYVDPDWAADNDAYTEAWQDKATTLGIFEYNYGVYYAVPRIHNDATARYLRHAAGHGVSHVFADGRQNFGGEAAKSWIYLKLLWDPQRDPDQLLDDWCTAAGGPEAGPYLKQYVQVFETAWSEQVPRTGWFDEAAHSAYFTLSHSAYLDGITDDDARRAREALENALAHASTDTQRARVEAILRAFSYHEATIHSYPHPVAAPTTTRQAIDLVRKEAAELDTRVDFARRRAALLDELATDPLYDLVNSPAYLRYRWSGFDGSAFWHLVDFLVDRGQDAGAVRVALQQVARTSGPQARRFASFVLRTADGEAANLVADPSAELPIGSSVPGHPEDQIWRNSGPGTQDSAAARTGDLGLAVPPTPAGEAIPRTGRNTFHQRIPLASGLTAARVFHRTDGTVDHGTLAISLDAASTEAVVVDRYQLMQRPIASDSDWTWIATMEDLPAEVGQDRIGAATLGIVTAVLQGEGQLLIDDAEVVHEASPTGEEKKQ